MCAAIRCSIPPFLKFLLLNQTFYPDEMASSQYLQDVALSLVQRGHGVTVVTSQRAYDDPDRRFPKCETWQGIRIFRVGSTGFGKTAKWRRATDFATFIGCCLVRLLFLPRYDVVVTLTSPPLISFLGAWLAKLRGSAFVYWIMDLNPDQAIAAGWLRRDSVPGKLFERMSRFSLQSANQIITLDRFMRDRIMAKGISPTKISVIPPWCHNQNVQFDAKGRERFRQTHGLAGKFVVMYSGNHSPCHPLETLLEAAQSLRHDPSILFCFVGGGSEFRKIQRLSPYGNILCLPYQPLNGLAASLSAADLHVVIMGDPFVGIVHPCKIYNILSMGAPALCIGPQPSHLSDLFGSLDNNDFRGTVKHGEVRGVLEHIAWARKSTGNLSREVPKMFKARYSKQALLPKLAGLLETTGLKKAADSSLIKYPAFFIRMCGVNRHICWTGKIR
jgi:glycosyltransferase involved in cell wall biosynthesis